MTKRFLGIGASLLFLFVLATPLFAGAPSGVDTFQLLTNVVTGGDNTGDGGTGNVADLNYYYVGQNFTTTMEIVSGGTTASNIWIDYISDVVSASNLSSGNYYTTWSGQSIDATDHGATGGRVYQTGSNIPVTNSSGTGSFGTVRWTPQKPTAASYGTSTPTTLDIEVGTIGLTTESNISLSGADILDDEEDFQFHVWADTVPPYAFSPSPVDTATGVSVSSNYTFVLCDSKDGESADSGTCLSSGVGTGVSTSEPPGALTFNDGAGASSYTSYDSFSCSGLWGTNQCTVTVNPPSPAGISGDSRNWEYNTTYTVDISGFRDLASSSQDQLGDANGPNTMSAKQYTFTTEADGVAPQVVSETPTRSATDQSASTNITVNVEDRKTYPNGISGEGLDSSTCQITVSSTSTGSNAYTSASGEVTITSTNYGAQFVINPASDFGQGETVTVSVSLCEDVVGNTMTLDSWTFTIADTDGPYIDLINPADDGTVDADGTLSFHLKDDVGGVDINTVVIYLDGTYYTNSGGSGQVTVTDTRITFDSSLDFNGSNYSGDTTALSGTPADYTFILDPETDFAVNDPIPVIVYAEDISGNIMERAVYAVVSEPTSLSPEDYCGADTSWDGSQCIGDLPAGSTYCGTDTTWDGSSCVGDLPAGSTYCGTNTSWDGSECIGTGGGSGSGYCGSGTTWDGSECVASSTGDGYCGSGTSWNGKECAVSLTGSSYCGSNTSWDGSMCVGTSSGGGGGSGSVPKSKIWSVSVTQSDEDSVIVSWRSNHEGDGRVYYDTEKHTKVSGYQHVIESGLDTKNQSVVIDGLKPNTVYYFRPEISTFFGTAQGDEVPMSVRFATDIVEKIVVKKEYIAAPVVADEEIAIDETGGRIIAQATPEPRILTQEKTWGRNYLLWYLILFTILFILAIVTSRHAWKRRKLYQEHALIDPYFKQPNMDVILPFVFSFFTFVMLAGVAILGAPTLRDYRGFMQLREMMPPERVAPRFAISGSVLDLATKEPVAGITLRLDDMSIETSESGRYIFESAFKGAVLEMMHLDLARPVTFLIDDASFGDIYVDIELYNVLYAIRDLEERFDYENLFSYVQQTASVYESLEQLRASYDIALGKAHIVDVKEKKDYVEIAVDVEGQKKTYRFMQEDGGEWKLLAAERGE